MSLNWFRYSLNCKHFLEKVFAVSAYSSSLKIIPSINTITLKFNGHTNRNDDNDGNVRTSKKRKKDSRKNGCKHILDKLTENPMTSKRWMRTIDSDSIRSFRLLHFLLSCWRKIFNAGQCFSFGPLHYELNEVKLSFIS